MCLTLIGGAISAAGALASASAQSASYKAQAKYQQRQASLEEQQGAYEANRQKTANDQQLADMRGQYLQSGIALEGSPSTVIESSATQASLDEQSIKFGSKIRADNARFSANLARANASSAMTGGYFKAAGIAVQTATDLVQQAAGKTMIRNPYAGF
jgi:hypothetical protein